MILRILNIAAWLIAGALLLLSISLYGCDSSKQAQRGWDKFTRNGGKINCKSDTLWQYDTTYLDGKVIIDSFPVPCDCGEPVIGYTNKQLRLILRHQKDSMAYLLKLEKIRAQRAEDSLNGLLKLKKEETVQIKWKTKEVVKTKRIENRSVWWLWYILGFASPLFIYFLIVRFVLPK